MSQIYIYTHTHPTPTHMHAMYIYRQIYYNVIFCLKMKSENYFNQYSNLPSRFATAVVASMHLQKYENI